MKNFLLIILSVAAMASCKPKQTTLSANKDFNTTDTDSVFITIERSPCMGACPWYSATIYESGLALYDGKRNVSYIGLYAVHLTPEQLKALKENAAAINYFKLNDKYNNEQITDLPGTTTSVQLNGKRKTILNRFGAPQQLTDFEKSIDVLFDNAEMIKMRQPVDRME